MYKVTKDGKVLTIAAKLLRVKHQANGVNVIDPEGPGVIVGGTIYNLPGHETVTVEDCSGDVRGLLDEVVADGDTANDIYLALAELGELLGGGM